MEPFNEAKYKALMDGLECSEVMLRDLEFSGRIDAEYYQKSYLQYEKTITAISSCQLSDIASFLIGPFGSAYDTNRYVDDSKYRYVRGQDVKPYLLQDSSPRYMSEADFLRLEKYALKPRDVLVSVVGTLGNAAIVQEADTPAIFSCKSTAIRGNKVNPYYLMVYLNTTYGRKLLLRKERGAIQKGLNLDDLKSLYVPLFDNSFVKAIEKIVYQAFLLLDNSKGVYNFAQSLLLSALNYYSIEQTESHTEKSFSASFGATGRLDAEYYQPKYAEYSQLVRSFTNGWTKISDVFTQIKTKCTRDRQSYRYVEIGDIDVASGTATPNAIDTCDLPYNAKIMTLSGDILVSTVRPNRGAVAILEEDDLLVSGAFTVLRQKAGYPKEVLQALLRTPLYKDWLLQTNVGTSYPVIKDDDVLNLPIPVFIDEINLSVLKKIQESFSLRRQSKQLLENAKYAVEMAIEQGEDKAMRWLQEQGEKTL